VRVPLTTGSSLTRVIFPADWRAWPREKRTAVLAHELAHARRRDPLIALIVAVNKCVFWFHPLAWWLEHRLPVLAEHAADDAALAVTFDTQAYARLLLDSVARLDNAGNRLIWHSSAMSGPVVAQRIRRVLKVRTPDRLKPQGMIGRMVLLSLGAILIWVSTTVDVPRLVAGQTNSEADNRAPWLLTTEEASALEQELAANPENETVRKKLLTYYGFANMCAIGVRQGLRTPPGCSDHMVETADRRIPLIIWLIDHHPESELLEALLISPQFDGPNVYEEVRNHWLAQVNLHPNDARVLVNAARAIGGVYEQMDLLKRAQKIDPARGTKPLSVLYSIILVEANDYGSRSYDGFQDPGIAAQIREELRGSGDSALIGAVAQGVVERAAGVAIGGPSAWDGNALRILATELVTHAQTLEPQNRDWSDLMEGVNRLPLGPIPGVAQKAPPVVQTDRVQAIRVGGNVQAANLQESPPPIYPPEAKAAGLKVQGTVKLQIRIGTDGHVREATVVSGDPMLFNAAMDAALRYQYKPTLLNGQPVDVLTDVNITF
jgi:TonB family protein